jgi:integrase
MDEIPSVTERFKPIKAIETPYVHAATSDNTRRAYQADEADFLKRGGQLPASPDMIVRYLEECALIHNPRTLVRRVTMLSQWHKLQNIPNPVDDPLVKKTLKGIQRMHGRPKRKALALRLEELDQITAYLTAQKDIFSIRNRALILIGFFGAMRRSELAALTWEDITFERDGMLIVLPRSKTDQRGEGQRIAIPIGSDGRCPLRTLLAWRQACKVTEGPVFRRLSKTGTVLKPGISALYVNHLVHQLAGEAGLLHPELYSAHSLRRGFATEAARMGASMTSIKNHGRWESTKTVIEYIEEGRQYSDSAVNVLFDFR